MSVLSDIKQELSHIVEAIQSVINIEITIVDENLVRLVGTGILAAEIGKKVPVNSAFDKALTQGRQFFIERPAESPVCADCAHRDKCLEQAELCIPLKYNNRTIGVLGMCAFTEDAKQSFVANRERLLFLEHQLNGIISTMLNEKSYRYIMEYRSSELTTLINSLNEGIAVLDNQRRLLTINRCLLKLLKANPGRMTPLESFLPRNIYAMLSEKNFDGEAGPVPLKGRDVLVTARPIMMKEEQHGVILHFSDFGKMRESVMSAERSKNILTFADIIGESEGILRARREAARIAAMQDVTVLLTGETGTGKEIFAQAIHAAGARSGEIFLPINCGAIPETLIESELFGYEKGAFTGASKTGQQGKFEICKNGTLFLDEIGDLPLATQVKLLRALDSRQIMRVGGSALISVNPRIISATNKDLRKMVEEKTFREDLYYRLSIVPIHIPPLRERGFDIIILARHFLRKFAAVYEKPLHGFTEECENLLMRYRFPGNIRELRNLIEYAVIFAEGRLLSVQSIGEKLLEKAEDTSPSRTLAEMIQQYEREIISSRLQRFGTSLDAKKKIAEHLGISVASLYRKLSGTVPPEE